MDPVELTGVVTITRAEYDLLMTESKKYHAYKEHVYKQSDNDIWEFNCAIPGCPAVIVGNLWNKDYAYINCKKMKYCYGCDEYFCNRHNIHMVFNKSNNSEQYKCCDKCLPRYLTDGFEEGAYDINA